MPIFADAIKEIYNLGNYYHLGKIVKINERNWEIPIGIIEKIYVKSCCLSTDWCESYKEYFIENNVPNETCQNILTLFRFK